MSENSSVNEEGSAEQNGAPPHQRSIRITANSVAISSQLLPGQDQVELMDDFERMAARAAARMIAMQAPLGEMNLSPSEALVLSYEYGEAPRLTMEPSAKAIRALGGELRESSPVRAAESAFKLAGHKLPAFTRLGLMLMGKLASEDFKRQLCEALQKDMIRPAARRKLLSDFALAFVEEQAASRIQKPPAKPGKPS